MQIKHKIKLHIINLTIFVIIITPPGMGAQYCDHLVCLSVCLSVCP